MVTFTLDQIKEKLLEIKARGFIKTTRPHDGGPGNTLEDLLGLTENNFRTPDLGEIELKAKRIESGAMLTLTSQAPLPRGVNKQLFNAYSYVSPEDNITRLYTTIYGSRVNPQGFKVSFNCDKLILENRNNIYAYWDTNVLFSQLKGKAEKTLLVYAKVRGKGRANEEYHYIEAYLLSGLSMEKFVSAIESDKLKVDIRIGADKGGKNAGKYHDHGTAVRICKRDFLHLFDTHIQVI